LLGGIKRRAVANELREHLLSRDRSRYDVTRLNKMALNRLHYNSNIYQLTTDGRAAGEQRSAKT